MDEDGAPLGDQNALQAAQTMLLRHLSLSAQAGDASSATAATFTICRMFFEEVRPHHENLEAVGTPDFALQWLAQWLGMCIT